MSGSTEGQLPTEVLLSGIAEIECLDLNLYRGQTVVLPTNQRVFGGQFLAQALNAASQTVKDNFVVHSLHCYFVRPGNPHQPIIYQVDRDHDGKSFAKRSVRGIQKGKVAFHMIASFALSGYSRGYDVQINAMPDVPSPENLISKEDLTREKLSNPRLPPIVRSYLTAKANLPFPTDIRPIDKKLRHERQQDGNGVIMAWMRVKDSLREDQLLMHTCGLAYLSDEYSVTAILLPYPRKLRSELLTASIDHSIWVHRPFRSDQWLLGVFRSTVSHSGKGLCHIEFYQNGFLVATCVQEGLARLKPKSFEPNVIQGYKAKL